MAGSSLLRRATAFFSLLFSAGIAAQTLPDPPSIAAKSWLLVDYASGQSLAGLAPDERVAPASLTKLMTAYLTFAAQRSGALSAERPVDVSDKAWRATGSRMFIEPGKPVTVSDLLQGLIVQSGNDAAIALAEALAGSEERFAERMNREAMRLGMKDTSFRNATGLPAAGHYSTARDLALLASATIRDFPEEYARHFAQKEFRYNDITQRNRNSLLFADATVDGVKTGSTEGAGYCLVASARRGTRRLISVVTGADSEVSRANESLKLLNWGFQSFDAIRLYEKEEPVARLRVWKGRANTVAAGFREEFQLAFPRGERERLKAEFVSRQPLTAPVSAGQVVGTLRVSFAGAPWGEFPAVALHDVPVAGFFGRLADTVRYWFE